MQGRRDRVLVVVGCAVLGCEGVAEPVGWADECCFGVDVICSLDFSQLATGAQQSCCETEAGGCEPVGLGGVRSWVGSEDLLEVGGGKGWVDALQPDLQSGGAVDCGRDEDRTFVCVVANEDVFTIDMFGC